MTRSLKEQDRAFAKVKEQDDAWHCKSEDMPDTPK